MMIELSWVLDYFYWQYHVQGDSKDLAYWFRIENKNNKSPRKGFICQFIILWINTNQALVMNNIVKCKYYHHL